MFLCLNIGRKKCRKKIAKKNVKSANMKYNCIVVNDNIIERDAVIMHLKKISSLKVVGGCESAQEALKLTYKQSIDIIFSDIQMPETNGIELSKSIKTPPVFIFISSFQDFAAENFKTDAIDFVLKPATYAGLLKATKKAIEYIELKKNTHIKNLKTPIGTDNLFEETVESKDYFFIKETNGYTKLYYRDVLYVESMGDFSKIHTIQGVTHVILVNLKHCEKQLPSDIFKRIHKQYVVNLSHVTTIAATDIVLDNDEEIVISNIYRQQLISNIVSKKLLHRS